MGSEVVTKKWIKVIQVGSPTRRHFKQRQTLIGLGLNRMRRIRLLRDTPEMRGMLTKVRHLVEIIDGPIIRLPASARDKVDVLKRFNRRVDRSEKSSFWRRYKDEVPNVLSKIDKATVTWTGPTTFEVHGIIYSQLEGFDQDEIAAFVLDYRQYTQGNDPISIGNLAKIYNEPWMPVEAAGRFSEIRAYLNRYLDSQSKLDIEGTRWSIRELAHVVVYGGLAHANTKKAKTFEAWEGSGIMGYVWAEFFAHLRVLMKTLEQIRALNEQLIAYSE
jgi:large subunit ribosomal protein L30